MIGTALTFEEAHAIRRRACFSKQRLRKQHARRAAKKRSAQSGAEIVAYKCPFSRPDSLHWHIGHPIVESSVVEHEAAAALLGGSR